MLKEVVLSRIQSRAARIGIVGLGYVGLPLAVAFAEEGFEVIGIDVSPEKVYSLNRGQSYIADIPSEQLAPLVQSGKLRASTQFGELTQADAVSICVPTPLNANKEPDLSFVIAAADAVIAYSHPGMLIVLESTTYPGTTDEVMPERLARKGLTIGSDVFIAFSPERIDPSNQKFNVRNTPKVVGGATSHCCEVASAYYGMIVERVVPVSSTAAAEMVKILENTFRAVNIGLVNEMALVCEKLGIDAWEVIDAAASKPFGFMPFYPGPGVGGHCIPIDPLYLSWKLRTLNYTVRFIEVAHEVNSSMPLHVVQKVMEGLNDDAKSVRCSKIAVLGVAYKRNVDDMRESPALEIIERLGGMGAIVEYHDPYVPSIHLEQTNTHLFSTPLTPDWLRAADCVLIVTDHTNVDYELVVEHSRLVVDTRHVTANVATPAARVVAL